MKKLSFVVTGIVFGSLGFLSVACRTGTTDVTKTPPVVETDAGVQGTGGAGGSVGHAASAGSSSL